MSQLVTPSELRAARQDRHNWNHPVKARGPQVAYALLDAVVRNPHHKLAGKIGRVTLRIIRKHDEAQAQEMQAA